MKNKLKLLHFGLILLSTAAINFVVTGCLLDEIAPVKDADSTAISSQEEVREERYAMMERAKARFELTNSDVLLSVSYS